MSAVAVLLGLAAACALCAGVSAALIARALAPHGVRTPFPLLGLYVFRNLRRYSEITRHGTGRAGPLFYAYLVAINAALVLVLIALGVAIGR
ncbi:MAG: hypothetical protein H6Q10_1330 [Acidobacteria bacterium]|nr:hypothetical protein [Acidobacteriota bacterium]